MPKDLFKIRESLIEVVEFYSWREYNGKTLSTEQRKQLTDVKNRLLCFGEMGVLWASLANEILSA